MKTKQNITLPLLNLLFILLFLSPPLSNKLMAQSDTDDLARYTPQWIRQGFADAGATHEPWIFQVRRNNPDFNQWQKAEFDYQLSEPYIKALSESGITVYHVGCYKGFGFHAEKEYMDKVSQAVAIAHKIWNEGRHLCAVEHNGL